MASPLLMWAGFTQSHVRYLIKSLNISHAKDRNINIPRTLNLDNPEDEVRYLLNLRIKSATS
jgi:hypothetical protein